jgi:hypothetical protein
MLAALCRSLWSGRTALQYRTRQHVRPARLKNQSNRHKPRQRLPTADNLRRQLILSQSPALLLLYVSAQLCVRGVVTSRSRSGRGN